jgi:Tol biopolymer transport system component/GH35 family endo-1,4-beta-xylanase
MQQKHVLLVLMLLLTLSDCLAKTRHPYQLAFASDRMGNGDIFILNEWGHLTNLTNSPEGDWTPRWSPDGRQLAFTSHLTNQADIWLINPDTRQTINLTNHPAWDYTPAWSPDGKTLVFVSERDGDAELFMQQIGNDRATQLTFNTYQDKLPSWSPKGDKIAFAAVVNGMERIYLLDLNNQNAITPLPNGDLNGTDPVWSPRGDQLAFVGWDESNQIGLYTFDLATYALDRLYASPNWFGSLAWSSDETWLFFTGRKAGNHDLMALNRLTGRVIQLTHDPAWDDFAALRPGQSFVPAPIDSKPKGYTPTTFGYGVNMADLSNAFLIQDIGFNYIKGYINWGTIEPEPGVYRWVDPDSLLRVAEGAGAQVLFRIQGTPIWARPENSSFTHPPPDLADFERFMRTMAARYRGRVAAYEIWNEPNLDYEWGHRLPNPAEYTALLKTAYTAIKAEDPLALVITAGLAPTGEGNPPAVLRGLAFIEGMYQAGAKGYFDALGSHPYSYNHPPDFESQTEITFDQVVKEHQLMARYGDADTPIWITEMGWVLETHWDLGEYHNQGVTQLDQAAYLKRAYQKIETEWPWVEAAFLFNLDFSTAPWYAASEQMRWFAILNPDHTPRPAYTALRAYRMGNTYENRH